MERYKPATFAPQAPWHMWGTSEDFSVTIAPGVGIVTRTSRQLARVNYRRPESWNFFFAIELLSITNLTINFNLFYFFDLVVGVGRSSIQLPNFCSFSHIKTGPPPVVLPLQSWSTATNTPPRNMDVTTPANSTNVQVCDYFVAEDIQCSVRAELETFSAQPQTLQFRATAYFAPRVHVRPDWHSGAPVKFLGQETGGT